MAGHPAAADGPVAAGEVQRAFLHLEDGEAANGLPPLHKDPMDRMLIASALRTGMTVITSDRIFAQYGVRTVW